MSLDSLLNPSVLTRQHPMTLSPDQQFVMAQIVDKADQEYGGVVDRLNHKWAVERREMEEEQGATTQAAPQQSAPQGAGAIPPKRRAQHA